MCVIHLFPYIAILSSLLLQLMQHSRDLSFRQEVQFRNQLAEYLTSWVKGQVCIAANASHQENLQKWDCNLVLVYVYFFGMGIYI